MHKHHSEYLRTAEAAIYCGFSRQFFEIARLKGTGPNFHKVGRAVRYRRSSLDHWMGQHEKKVCAPHHAETASMGGNDHE